MVSLVVSKRHRDREREIKRESKSKRAVPTSEALGLELAKPVLVDAELLQRGRQQRQCGKAIRVQIQPPQLSQVLEQEKKKINKDK